MKKVVLAALLLTLVGCLPSDYSQEERRLATDKAKAHCAEQGGKLLYIGTNPIAYKLFTVECNVNGRVIDTYVKI